MGVAVAATLRRGVQFYPKQGLEIFDAGHRI